jgi:hypothetical protein
MELLLSVDSSDKLQMHGTLIIPSRIKQTKKSCTSFCVSFDSASDSITVKTLQHTKAIKNPVVSLSSLIHKETLSMEEKSLITAEVATHIALCQIKPHETDRLIEIDRVTLDVQLPPYDSDFNTNPDILLHVIQHGDTIETDEVLVELLHLQQELREQMQTTQQQLSSISDQVDAEYYDNV